MSKKGVELSMNVIIIAAIGLLVLVILAVMVINSSGRLQGGIQGSCSTKAGVCRSVCNAGEEVIQSDKPLCDASYQCCGIFKAQV
jgi:hypothetical protein